METNRIIWIDVLNVIACMGVLVLHSTNTEVHGFTGSVTGNWLIGLSTHSLMLWPVNVFFMLSGYTLMRHTIIERGGVKRFFHRRLKRLLLPVLVWNTLYMIIFMLKDYHHGSFSLSAVSFIDHYLSFKFNSHMWFFLPLICIYLSMSFLSLFVLNASRNILKWFIIMYVLMNAAGCFGESHSAHFNEIYLLGTRFLLFTVAGYYLGHFDLSLSTRRKLYILGWISTLVIFAGTMLLQLKLPEHYNFFLKYTNIPCTLSAFAVFVYCKNTDWSHVLRKLHIKESNLIQLSSASLGIYLIQAICFSIVRKVYVFAENLLLQFVVMYVLCVIVVLLIKRTPRINKII